MAARLGFPNLAGTAPDAAAPLPIGAQIEAHSVLQVLSEGPNGFVYLTRDATHGATRVLKEFMPRSRLLRLSDGSVRPCDVSDSIATSVARIAFMNEANTLAAFQHPALIRVLGVIPAHRTLYRVMPLVDGVSLEQHARTRAEPPSLAWLHGLVEGLLQALEVLHERRLGHGSVRPAQVMVRESGQPLLLGFASVARELDTVSPTQWQSPGTAHLTRHAPPLPAEDLPALAETAYFAATGLAAPTLQQRLEGLPIDVGAVLDALPDGPGDAQQRRRGLLLALEAALTTPALARPQSVAEFRRLLTGDVPSRGGRREPTPRWVGEMPERDETSVDLLISQPAPLSDDVPPMRRRVAAAPAPAAALQPVVLPQMAPAERAPAVDAPALATLPTPGFNAPASPSAPARATDPTDLDAEGVPDDRTVDDGRVVPETAWPFEPEPAVAWQEPAARVLSERTATPPAPAAPAVPAVPPAPAAVPRAEATSAPHEPAPAAVVAPIEPAFGDAPASDFERGRESAVEPRFELPGRRRVERDFAATEFLVASAEPNEAFRASSQAPDADTEPFVASLRPQPLARPRSPYAAMAAAAVLALVGVGIAAWWQGDAGPTQVAGAPTAQQAPVPGTAAVEATPSAVPAAAAPTTAGSALAAAPQAPPASAQGTAAMTAPVEPPGVPGANATAAPPLASPAAPAVPEPTATTAAAANAGPAAVAEPTAPPAVAPAPVTAAAPTSGNAAAPAAPTAAQAATTEPPADPVAPANAARATRSPAGAAPPPAARPTAPSRTPTAAAPRSARPAATRANGSSARTATAPAPAPRSTVRALSPLAACGNRTQFSLVYCMQQQCARPAYQAHPQCADLRNGG